LEVLAERCLIELDDVDRQRAVGLTIPAAIVTADDVGCLVARPTHFPVEDLVSAAELARKVTSIGVWRKAAA
jgi:hypothetical protein